MALAAVVVSLGWAYAPTLQEMYRKWADDPQYSHGFLVGPFALFLLWVRRGERPGPLGAPSAGGLLWLAAGAVIRVLAARLYLDWLDGVSLLLCLAGVVVLRGGISLLRWGWPALAFLLFMIPLPHRLETALAGTLQDVAASSCAAVLNTLGRPTAVEGNVLLVNESRVEVVAACSGLGSLLVFFAMATAVVLISRPPLLDRGLLLASTFPIALGTNVIRITATVLLCEWLGESASPGAIHDGAGWCMMLLALGILRAELWLLRLLFIEADPNSTSTTPCDAAC